MENPNGWDLLTSSLATSKLTDPSTTWAFLVLQGLVRDDENARGKFGKITKEVLAEGPITGPSEPCRISSALVAAGLNLPPSRTPDPWGKIAKSRMEMVNGWSQEAP